jgi:hypothetical protein
VVILEEFTQQELVPPPGFLYPEFPDGFVEKAEPGPQSGDQPWNGQFEDTDRPNACRLMCK